MTDGGGGGSPRPLNLTNSDAWLEQIHDRLGEIRDRLPEPPPPPAPAKRAKRGKTSIDGL